jgi:hypothetical protein
MDRSTEEPQMKNDLVMDDQIDQLEDLQLEINDPLTSTRIRKWTAMAKLIRTNLKAEKREAALETVCALLLDLAIEVADSKKIEA